MKWTRNGTEEITANKGRIHIEESRAGPGLALVFESIETKDKGNYTCKAMVDGKEVQASFVLIVIKPIKFADTATVQTVSEYQNVVVPCEVDGDPEPEINWTVNGKLPQGPKYKVVADGLCIENVTLEDKGEYKCRAYQLSSVKSNVLVRTIILNIEHKPVWRGEEGYEKSYAFISGTANLTCEVTAEPKPKFEWLKGSKTLKSQENATIFQEEFRTILQVQVSSKNAFGDYICKASNSLGKMEQVITLIEVSKPAVPKMSVRGARHDSVQIDIEGPENEELGTLGYRVQYLKRQEMHKGWDSAQEVKFNKAESPYILSGLSQNTQYVVRVATWNAAGFSDYTQERSFSTEKIHADPVTGSTNSAISVSLKASQLITIIAVHNIISVTSELKHNL
ncbi:limbic system-associated membrane protein-like isoform X2 [Zootermopsis nevadensis]|uniref:Neural cell adhesion molecule 1-B n=2 Tax=Zootermopsis nevadensis TaxID=136037 RepID=A0A067R4S6_ZOONE|nr:limbic system-associated membrane protein-like isoform X2 [Zootermopsis nevadensis]XP_021922221.1 limbic system-associated membrane protein-like isoform X2 [Zootermopsis nevadensis]XP_021922222.1 limbic system-associated membrane protein-like isoform X2 [Zootermopsis nevadensis]XP_021922223.1 limbic system-associated membrane protein-like isoform X2 [Zootermopsis nevadensis]XP_021922224.1 limbic system-associated membrane protein-like isoform X2 [Zootermopsis nevadensis]XP_021922225.1 limbi